MGERRMSKGGAFLQTLFIISVLFCIYMLFQLIVIEPRERDDMREFCKDNNYTDVGVDGLEYYCYKRINHSSGIGVDNTKITSGRFIYAHIIKEKKE